MAPRTPKAPEAVDYTQLPVPDFKTTRSLIIHRSIAEDVYTFVGVNDIYLHNRGLVHVIGRNLDTEEPSSSGAGKSRWFAVLERCLFGGESLDSTEAAASLWRKDAKGKDAPGRIEAHFSRYGFYYIVRLANKHKQFGTGLSLWRGVAGGTFEQIGAKNDKKGLEEEIRNLVGRTRDEFLGTTLWKQGHGHVLIQGKPSERIEWLSKLFGLTHYDRIAEELARDLEKVRSSLATVQPAKIKQDTLRGQLAAFGDMQQTQQEVNALSAQLVATDAKLSDLQVARQQVSKKLAEIQSMQKVLSEIADLGATPEQVQQAQDAYRVACVEINAIQERAAGVQHQLDSYAQQQKVLKELESYDDATRKLAGSPEDLDQLAAYLQKASETVAAHSPLLSAVQRVESEYSAALTAYENGLTALGLDSSFDPAVFASKIEHWQDRTAEAHDNVAVLRADIAKCKKALDLRSETCPTCGGRVDLEHFTAEIAKNQPLLASWLDYENKAQESLNHVTGLNNLYVQYSNAKSRYEDPKHRAESSEVIRARIEEARAYLTQNTPVLQAARTCRQVLARVAPSGQAPVDPQALQTDLAECRRLLAETEANRERFSKLAKYAAYDLTASTDDTALVAELANIDSLSQGANQTRTAVVERLAILRHSLATFVRTETEAASLNPQVAEYNRLAQEEEDIVDLLPAYGKKGFKTFKLRRLLELIKIKLPMWTRFLFTEKTFHVDVAGDESKLTLIVRKHEKLPNGDVVVKEYDAGQCSGGEKTRLAICVMLTLLDIVADDRKSNMLVLDETDRHMDRNSLHLMADTVIPLLRGRVPSLYVISHQLPLNRADFDHEMVVTKKNERSVVTMDAIGLQEKAA